MSEYAATKEFRKVHKITDDDIRRLGLKAMYIKIAMEVEPDTLVILNSDYQKDRINDFRRVLGLEKMNNVQIDPKINNGPNDKFTGGTENCNLATVDITARAALLEKYSDALEYRVINLLTP